ncbi:hypothetical protein ON010_g10629 [Phytophthora cinnamomi]|nr:hypothetical protein ON010_g10629 [Phytophthora cinnamomi]
MPNDYCQQHGGSSVCVLENCYKRAVRGGMCSEHKTEASLQAITASGLTIPGRSSDEDRRRRPVRHKSGAAISTHQTVNPARTPEWQSRMNLCATTGSPSPESRVSATSIVSRFLRSEGSTRSPSPVRPPIRNLDELRQSDSPVAPGFSALLNADDRFPLFSADNKTLTHTQRYTRPPRLQLSQQQQQHEHQVHREHKVYPLLPGIHSLQNCRHETSSCGGRSSRTWSESSMLVLKASNSETVATHKVRSADFGEERVDPDEYAEEAPSEKQHVNSYYHRFTTESSWHVKHSTNGSSDSVHYC